MNANPKPEWAHGGLVTGEGESVAQLIGTDSVFTPAQVEQMSTSLHRLTMAKIVDLLREGGTHGHPLV